VTAELIDGKKIAEKLRYALSEDAQELRDLGIPVGLVTIRVGSDFSAALYQRRIERLAAETDLRCKSIALAESTSQAELTGLIEKYNNDSSVSGILLLRPLPIGIDEPAVFASLSPIKDIEAVHPENAGLLALGTPRYIPSTAASVFHILDSWLADSGIDPMNFYRRSRIVVVGRSNNVGKPAIALAYGRQASVTSVDVWASRNNQLGWHTRRADVLIVAAGAPGLIRSEHVRPEAVIIDVGINPQTDPNTGKTTIVGDVSMAEVLSRARAITPVPGGVGPVTDVWLLHNTILAARTQAGYPNLKAAFDPPL
jgi:methylenetetrahydrofolate dehydrogenase (NADP+)/methenyltetrahydrofolate cyclohydrolase